MPTPEKHPGDDIKYVGHMFDVARKIEEFLQTCDRSRFDIDEPLQIAFTHLIQTIGEAARNVSTDFRDAHPEIAWHQVTGMRHRIVHDYVNVDVEIVWNVITQHIPLLQSQLNEILDSDEGS